MNKSIDSIREMFISYFTSKNHHFLPGSSLVPFKDSSLLITNSGMNQFKRYFLGLESIPYKKVVTVQNCVRAGGKFNDLENIGYKNYHHTFFEMLGNFSFGSYFKEETIRYAVELLTSKDWFNLSGKRIWVTVHHNDVETYNIWKDQNIIPSDHIVFLPKEKDVSISFNNFWKMGNTGPCGPCTEVFYDQLDYNFNNSKEEFLDSINIGEERYIELWNMVFMQYNRNKDGTLKILSKNLVDTGAGLERLASILQGVNSTYNIDSFKILINLISEVIKPKKYNKKLLRILSDHIRSSSFLIIDNVFPSNEGRGYVLRKIIRRAIKYGYLFGIKKAFFYKLVNPLCDVMYNSINKLNSKRDLIKSIIKDEEIKYFNLLSNGLKFLSKEISKLKSNRTLDGSVLFYLHDTYGFPLDLTVNFCKKHCINIDISKFNLMMNRQKDQSKKKNKFFLNLKKENYMKLSFINTFEGYEKHFLSSKIIGVLDSNKKKLDFLDDQKIGFLILNKTIFYPQSCGQIGDSGIIFNKNCKFYVENTIKVEDKILHFGRLLNGFLKINDQVELKIDLKKRNLVSANHTATHILNKVLRTYFGENIQQKGSFISDKYFHLDFSYYGSIDFKDLSSIEKEVNSHIVCNYLVYSKNIDSEFKQNIGLYTGVQNNSYFDDRDKLFYKNRFICIDRFSEELCGGTHVKSTGEIGLFKIRKLMNISSGTKRIESITGKNAINFIQKESKILRKITGMFYSSKENILDSINKFFKRMKSLQKFQKKTERNLIYNEVSFLSKNIEKINQINLLVSQLDLLDKGQLLKISRLLKGNLKFGIIFLFFKNQNKIFFVTSVTDDLTARIQAKNLVSYVIKKVNGKGGGNEHTAQGVLDFNLDKSIDFKFLIKEYINTLY